MTARTRPHGADLERSDGRPDVLLVEHNSPQRRASTHGPSASHWTVQYGLGGIHHVNLGGLSLTIVPDSLLVYRRESVIVPPYADPPDPQWESLYACFELDADWHPPDAFKRLGEGVYRLEVKQALTRQRIRDAFARLLSDWQARAASRALAAFALSRARVREESLRELMLMTLREILLLAAGELASPASLDSRIREALTVMSADPSAPHTLSSLGEACHLSPSRFAHLFRAELGVSPLAALRLMRLRQVALQLQHTSDPIGRIAERTGFSSLPHLSREFRRQFGVTPRDFRRQVAPSDGVTLRNA